MTQPFHWDRICVLAGLFVPLFPTLVFADNCGSLTDCFGTAAAAAAGAAGVAGGIFGGLFGGGLVGNGDSQDPGPLEGRGVPPLTPFGQLGRGIGTAGRTVATGARAAGGAVGAGGAAAAGAAAGGFVVGVAGPFVAGYVADHAAEVDRRPDPDEQSLPGGVADAGAPDGSPKGPPGYRTPDERDDTPFFPPPEPRPQPPPPVYKPPSPKPEPERPRWPSQPRRRDPSPFREPDSTPSEPVDPKRDSDDPD